MAPAQIVIDTNVLISALRSNKGAAFKLLSLIGTGKFDIHLSVPLVLEYEDAAKRLLHQESPLTTQAIDDIIDYICLEAYKHEIFFLWRPFLKDPGDDLVLELAVKSGCPFIVTYNTKDFIGIQQFGIQAITPQALIKKLGV